MKTGDPLWLARQLQNWPSRLHLGSGILHATRARLHQGRGTCQPIRHGIDMKKILQRHRQPFWTHAKKVYVMKIEILNECSWYVMIALFIGFIATFVLAAT